MHPTGPTIAAVVLLAAPGALAQVATPGGAPTRLGHGRQPPAPSAASPASPVPPQDPANPPTRLGRPLPAPPPPSDRAGRPAPEVHVGVVSPQESRFAKRLRGAQGRGATGVGQDFRLGAPTSPDVPTR